VFGGLADDLVDYDFADAGEHDGGLEDVDMFLKELAKVNRDEFHEEFHAEEQRDDIVDVEEHVIGDDAI
jgi:hypothetical protein